MTPIRSFRQRQQGTTLLIALIFLVILTLFAVSGMNTGIINLRTANNVQLMIEAEYAAQRQIELMLSSVTGFMTAVDPVYVDEGTIRTDVERPTCLSTRPAPDYPYEFQASAPKDTVWEVVATATDTTFGTKVILRQGVRIRMPVNAVCVN
jgi:hypothetical protein